MNGRPEFSETDRAWLSITGWSVQPSSAECFYRGGVHAKVWPDGRYLITVWSGGYDERLSVEVRSEGAEDAVNLAVMAANNIARVQPEYLRAPLRATRKD